MPTASETQVLAILHSSKQPVKLGRGGIQVNRITPDAFERGFVAIQNHMETIEKFKVAEIRAFATSAIRNASNGIIGLSRRKRPNRTAGESEISVFIAALPSM